MRGLFTASYWLGLPACTAGVHLTHQLSGAQPEQTAEFDPGYENLCNEDAKPPVAGATLKHVQVLFRHGARTPLTRRYWQGSTWEDCGDAYTEAVAAQSAVAGRSAHVKLPEMKVYDKHTQQRQDGFIDGENLTHYPGGCTRGELTKLGQRQDQNNSTKVSADAHIRKLMGMPLDEENRLSWTELHDALTSMRAHGQAVPEDLTPAELDVVDALATARVVQTLQDHKDPTVLGLALGRLLQAIQDILDRAAGEGGVGGMPRLWMWCGHDTTIIPMLLMLGQDVKRWPPYSSSVVLELWEDSSEAARARPVDERHYVRVLFNGHEVAVPPATTAPGKPLTLAQFKRDVVQTYALTHEVHAERCVLESAPEPSGGAPVDTSSIT